MSKFLTTVIVVLTFCAPELATAQDVQADTEGEWFYFVKTEPSDPAREAEFNAWYDDIDIPDVLAAPSFIRARRAVGQEVAEFPNVGLREGDGKYVALYDIETSDIDKSIIDLYVIARKMNALGRSTDALRVVEANYYRRLGYFAFPLSSARSDNHYFYVQKILCCRSQAERTQYRNWFNNEHLSALRDTKGTLRVSLYVLYRIMEELAVDEDEIPHLLAVYEVEAESAKQALSTLAAAFENLERSGPAENDHEVRDSILYSQMSDVRSE